VVGAAMQVMLLG